MRMARGRSTTSLTACFMLGALSAGAASCSSPTEQHAAASMIYVANSSLLGSVTSYDATASGDVPPSATLSGGMTGLAWPFGLALDSSGRLYVANAYATNNVTVYALGASGDVAPTATIAGLNTGLDYPIGLVLDGAGRLYVANDGDSTITVYAPGAAGNAAPIATIGGANSALHSPQGLTVDGAGRLYVSNPFVPAITIYAAGRKRRCRTDRHAHGLQHEARSSAGHRLRCLVSSLRCRLHDQFH